MFVLALLLELMTRGEGELNEPCIRTSFDWES